jgi:hypothetical protein
MATDKKPRRPKFTATEFADLSAACTAYLDVLATKAGDASDPEIVRALGARHATIDALAAKVEAAGAVAKGAAS